MRLSSFGMKTWYADKDAYAKGSGFRFQIYYPRFNINKTMISFQLDTNLMIRWDADTKYCGIGFCVLGVGLAFDYMPRKLTP